MSRATTTEAVLGVVADLDGMITSTARLHQEAWRRAWEETRQRWGQAAGDGAPLGDEDYREHLDGRPRYEGAAAFLASRGAQVPEGRPADAPDRETVCGFGNHKNALYQRLLEEEGADPFPDARIRLQEWRARGIPVAMATASRNGRRVVESAGLGALFAAQVDGEDMARLALGGKHELFAEAARRLGLAPGQAALLEDSRAGLEAGQRAGFGWVIGVARGGREDLRVRADRVVADLLEVRLPNRGPAPRRRAREVPEVADLQDDLFARLHGYEPALFLDFDGTLSPIVEDPAEAAIHPEAREALVEAARRLTVCVVSGRDRADVAARVGLDQLTYAGSHGMDIAGPDVHLQHEEAQAAVPALDDAEELLRRRLADVPGAVVERKRFGLAIHYRMVAGEAKEEVQRAVREVREGAGGRLRQAHGKEVVELQPPIDWHKGRAIEFLIERLGLDRAEVVPIYIGDDLTDEDAFEALGERGIGVLVGCPERLTFADYRLPDDPAAVAALIREVAREAD